MEYATVYLILVALFGLFMAWGVGANDVANAMGTSVGSGVLTVRQAVIVAAIFEFAGAYLAGGSVTETIRKGIVDTSLLTNTPELLIFGMLASLLAAALWLLIASHFGWPVSTTHSIVGAIVGFAAVGIGIEAVKWGKVSSIVMSWVVSPLLAGLIAYALFRSVQRLVLDTEKPFENAKRYVPIYMFFAGFIMTLVTLLKGLKHVGLHLTTEQSYLTAVGVGLLVSVIGALIIRRMQIDPEADRNFHYANVERVFGVLMVVTACSMAFAHGSNDVANAIGPVAAVVSVIDHDGVIGQKSELSAWILLLGAGGIVFGLLTYGHRVMATIGKKITELTPSRGFACELSAATTVVLASGTGLPISTTHTLVGAVLGVGFARGIAALNVRMIRTIFMSWIVTLPAGAFFSILFFFIFTSIFT
jgi:PiT family inorganic phosphate transporter